MSGEPKRQKACVQALSVVVRVYFQKDIPARCDMDCARGDRYLEWFVANRSRTSLRQQAFKHYRAAYEKLAAIVMPSVSQRLVRVEAEFKPILPHWYLLDEYTEVRRNLEEAQNQFDGGALEKALPALFRAEAALPELIRRHELCPLCHAALAA